MELIIDMGLCDRLDRERRERSVLTSERSSRRVPEVSTDDVSTLLKVRIQLLLLNDLRQQVGVDERVRAEPVEVSCLD